MHQLKATLYITILAVMLSISLSAQKTITCNFNNAKMSIVFDKITEQTGLLFSYSNIDSDTKINLNVKEASIEEVMPLLAKQLNTEVVLKGKYVIVKAIIDQLPKSLKIYGVIKDERSGYPIKAATVYIKNLKTATNTDAYGRYSLIVPSKNGNVELLVNKENYLDTLVMVLANKNQDIAITLRPVPKARIAELDAIEQIDLSLITDKSKQLPVNFTFWNKIETNNAQVKNIKETFFKPVAFSLIPPISTNKLLAFNTRNSVGINMIGGYSKGIDYAEVGGVYNLAYGDVKYAQVAGVGNMVFGKTQGAQVAGVYNLVKGESIGAQVAGVANYTTRVIGAQVSGVANMNYLQVKGVQVSGVYQHTDTLNGVQVAGVYNRAKHAKGVQVSGVINQADTLVGLQIGLINFSNNSDKGMAIGLFNFVKNGYKKLELSYDDKGFASIAGRSGTNRLHSYIKAGYRNQDASKLAQLRFGLGSSLPLNNVFNIELDLSNGSIKSIDDIINSYSSQHSQFLVGLSYQPAKHLGIRAGITFNHLYYSNNDPIASALDKMTQQTIYYKNGVTSTQKMWLGYHVSLLF